MYFRYKLNIVDDVGDLPDVGCHWQAYKTFLHQHSVLQLHGTFESKPEKNSHCVAGFIVIT